MVRPTAYLKIPRVEDYEPIVGKKVVEQIHQEAEPLVGKHIVHINSTFYGGGVAEMLNSIVPLFNTIGIETGWRLLKGSPDFFHVSRALYDGVQGEKINLSRIKKKIYEKTSEINARFTHLEHDCVIVHDHQPLPLIKHYKKSQPWIWRCHSDFSNPNKDVFKYLRQFLKKYDTTVYSKTTFMHEEDPCTQELIYPAIDPLSPKNKDLPEKTVRKYLKRFNISEDRPIIAQVGRFDKWKDQVGTIQAFRKIKEKCDCQLVLLGSFATDDPEGQKMYDTIVDFAAGDPDIHIINYQNNILANVVQRSASVAVQKSLREGFGLAVTEALWKETPVVAGNVGGIPLQVKNGVNGYLVDSVDACAKSVMKLLQNPKKARAMGRKGKEIVRKKFLITRQALDWIRLLKKRMIYYKCNKNAKL